MNVEYSIITWLTFFLSKLANANAEQMYSNTIDTYYNVDVRKKKDMYYIILRPFFLLIRLEETLKSVRELNVWHLGWLGYISVVFWPITIA